MAYFVQAYGKVGVQFDDIYGWEVRQAPDFMASVPPVNGTTVHFYNRPIWCAPAPSVHTKRHRALQCVPLRSVVESMPVALHSMP